MNHHESFKKNRSSGIVDNENEGSWGAVQKEGRTDTK